MSDYTPTTEEVRGEYAGAADLGYEEPHRLDEFDRWLAAHDAEIRADEREKAAQRLTKAQPWTNNNETYLSTEYAVSIARGDRHG